MRFLGQRWAPPCSWSLATRMGCSGVPVCDAHAAKAAEPWARSPTFRPCLRGAFVYISRACISFSPPPPTSFLKSCANLTKGLRNVFPALGIRLVVFGSVSCIYLQFASFSLESNRTRLIAINTLSVGSFGVKTGLWQPLCLSAFGNV